jgi:hypothetical protein
LFEIIKPIEQIETFAQGTGIRELQRLQKLYGKGKWPKRKGIARVKLSHGEIVKAELHWYEASGLGKFEFKIKQFL